MSRPYSSPGGYDRYDSYNDNASPNSYKRERSFADSRTSDSPSNRRRLDDRVDNDDPFRSFRHASAHKLIDAALYNTFTALFQVYAVKLLKIEPVYVGTEQDGMSPSVIGQSLQRSDLIAYTRCAFNADALHSNMPLYPASDFGQFSSQVSLRGILVGSGTGSNKKTAKAAAAEAALRELAPQLALASDMHAKKSSTMVCCSRFVRHVVVDICPHDCVPSADERRVFQDRYARRFGYIGKRWGHGTELHAQVSVRSASRARYVRVSAPDRIAG